MGSEILFVSLRACVRMRVRVYIKEWFFIFKKTKKEVFSPLFFNLKILKILSKNVCTNQNFVLIYRSTRQTSLCKQGQKQVATIHFLADNCKRKNEDACLCACEHDLSGLKVNFRSQKVLKKF